MPPRSSPTSVAVERAFAILEFLDSTQRKWNISEISRRLKLPKSTTHILILTLERLGYLQRDPVARSFSLSLKLSGLGRSVLKNMPLPTIALPFMRALAQSLRLTTHLAMLEKGQAIYVQKVDGPGFIRFDTYIGKRTNLHCTAVGKVLLAHSPAKIQEEYLSKTTFSRHTKRTITSSSQLKKELLSIQQQGWAMDDQEEELDVRCLAAPVYGEDNNVVAALGISGTVGQVPEETIPKLIGELQTTTALLHAAIH